MKRLRIAMISEHASPLAVLGGADSGGQNVYVAQLARQLAEAGHRVDIFTRRDSPELAEVQCWSTGIRVVHVPAGPPRTIPKEKLLPFMEDFATFTAGFMRRAHYDIVHANFWMSGMVARRIKEETGIPFVITFHALGRVRRLHQGEADGFPASRGAIEDEIVAAAGRIIAECPQDEADLLQHYTADPRQITTIPCGVDTQEMRPIARDAARKTLDLSQEEAIILSLGRIVPRKGIDTVIRAVSLLKQAHGIETKLLVVGGEPKGVRDDEALRLQRLACELGVDAHVRFCGPQPRETLRQYYSASDVFVTAPWYEPFGMTPLEAMACGISVVGSNVGGVKFSVQDGVTGYLVPPKDPDALAVRLACLLRSPDLARAMGSAGFKRATTEFTWKSIAARIGALYDEVIAEANSARRTASLQASLVRGAFDDAMDTLRATRDELAPQIVRAAQMMAATFARGGKVLVCGNGGSAADAQHFATELVGRFKISERRGLPVVALTADTAILTAWANDVGYSDVFARQVEALGSPGDLLLGISTSGRSPNVVAAFGRAKELGIERIALTGCGGGDLAELACASLTTPSYDTQHIQEAHSVIIHVLCELVENYVAGEGDEREAPRLASVGVSR
jgi:phosphoheptose isomerase